MDAIIEENTYPTPRQTNTQMTRSIRDMSAKVSTKRNEGVTEYGFPSTKNQGKYVPQKREHDRTMENEHLITKTNPVQSTIKTLRQQMKEQGGQDSSIGAGASGSPTRSQAQQDGVFGGIGRVYEGFIQTSAEFQKVPGQSRSFIDQQ